MDALEIFELAQEEADEHEEHRLRPHVDRVFRDRMNPLEEYDGDQFIKRFRITKDTFNELLGLLRLDLEHQTRRSSALTPALQLTCAMRYFSCGAFQIVVGDTAGISQQTCGQAIHKVAAAICAIKHHFIHFPQNVVDRHNVIRGFQEIAGFPGVVGAIDGSHIPIRNPGGDDAQLYMNRKGWYSLNCQSVCDHQKLFTNVVCRWYGSAHDSRIWEESSLFQQFQNGELSGILIGEAAYTCRPFLLTPVRQERNEPERLYNVAHRKTRSRVENAFGIYKRRFPCVGFGNQLRCSMQHNMAIIVATACLHNLATRCNDPIPDDEEDLVNEIEDVQRAGVEGNIRGGVFRQRFIRENFA